MPPVRSLAFIYCTLLVASISLNSEIINPCSHYIKKGLVYIALASPFRRQPSSYLKCIKANTQLSYNIHFIPLNKYICLTVHY
jgi:hypothetical protein